MESKYSFDKPVNCFVGNNGIGKTNTLDAIYHLSMAKSYFSSINSDSISHDKNFSKIKGIYDLNAMSETIECKLIKGKSKIFIRNGKKYKKFSDHIGLLPVVMISPSDIDLINEGSVNRRGFIDKLISQSDKTYLKTLVDYTRLISQRNSLLKNEISEKIIKSTLEIYDDKLAIFGTKIYNTRKKYLSSFRPYFIKRYMQISGNVENVTIDYKSQLNCDLGFSELLKNSFGYDKKLMQSNVGVHRDDLIFKINGESMKRFASQGQRKSFLVSLKLAQFDMIKNSLSLTPILLLDDIFDKLDENRVKKIINLVNESSFGQLFITDTHYERTKEVIKQTNQEFKIFKL